MNQKTDLTHVPYFSAFSGNSALKNKNAEAAKSAETGCKLDKKNTRGKKMQEIMCTLTLDYLESGLKKMIL